MTRLYRQSRLTNGTTTASLESSPHQYRQNQAGNEIEHLRHAVQLHKCTGVAEHIGFERLHFRGNDGVLNDDDEQSNQLDDLQHSYDNLQDELDSYKNFVGEYNLEEEFKYFRRG